MDWHNETDNEHSGGVNELIARSLEGDSFAITSLISEYQNALLKTFLALDCRRQEAEEFVHDTFVRAFGQLDTYEPGKGSFKAWLYGVGLRVYRERAKHFTRRRRNQEVYREERARFWRRYLQGHSKGPATEDPLKEIWEDVSALSAEERHMIHLRFVEDLDPPEMGSVLGMTPVAVRVRMTRIIRKIRRRLKRRHDARD